MSALLTCAGMVQAAHEAALLADEAAEATAVLVADALARDGEARVELNEYLRVKAHQRLAWAIYEATVLDVEVDQRRSA